MNNGDIVVLNASTVGPRTAALWEGVKLIVKDSCICEVVAGNGFFHVGELHTLDFECFVIDKQATIDIWE